MMQQTETLQTVDTVCEINDQCRASKHLFPSRSRAGIFLIAVPEKASGALRCYYTDRYAIPTSLASAPGGALAAMPGTLRVPRKRRILLHIDKDTATAVAVAVSLSMDYKKVFSSVCCIDLNSRTASCNTRLPNRRNRNML